MSKRNLQHGHCRKKQHSKTWTSWSAMRRRCNGKNSDNYKFYGQKGIRVCERWSDFELFLADMGERPVGKTLDRIDSGGDYSLENCKWSTPTEQTRNRRNTIWIECFEEKIPRSVFLKKYGISWSFYDKYSKLGFSPEQILSEVPEYFFNLRHKKWGDKK